MGFLESKFTKEDIDTLLTALDDWEMLGNNDFHWMQMIKQSPMPPKDHEAYETFKMLKESFVQREKEILNARAVRQERAIFLKAKLMLVRQDMSVDQLFEMATTTDSTEKKIAVKGDSEPVPVKVGTSKLQLAESFMKEINVWSHYQKFLQEKQAEIPTATPDQLVAWAEFFIKDLGAEKLYADFLDKRK
jgi:hypothetical protein